MTTELTASDDCSSNSHHVYLVRPGEGEEGGRRCILTVATEDLEVIEGRRRT